MVDFICVCSGEAGERKHHIWWIKLGINVTTSHIRGRGRVTGSMVDKAKAKTR